MAVIIIYYNSNVVDVVRITIGKHIKSEGRVQNVQCTCKAKLAQKDSQSKQTV